MRDRSLDVSLMGLKSFWSCAIVGVNWKDTENNFFLRVLTIPVVLLI